MDGKAIFNGFIAKMLVKNGNRIIDLQPDRNRKNATIFYFEPTDKFYDDLKKITSK